MRIFLHDYSGHPFQVQLSRWLASQGHVVLHTYSADFETPQGSLVKTDDDPETFHVEALTLGRSSPKYNFVRRQLAEKAFAKVLIARLRQFKPDLVISSNTPPFVQDTFLPASKALGAEFIFWLQDIYAIMATKVLVEKYGPLGKLVGGYIRHLEDKALRRCDAIVAISEDFIPLLTEKGLPREKISVVENWAPLAEMPERPRDNSWAQRHGLGDKFVYLYAGTLGLKHNPDLIARLAAHHRDNSDVAVIVATQGLGRTFLEEKKLAENLDNLTLLDFQPFDELPDMLGSADVLISILEPEAGVMSVPSKVLSYLCSGRAILGAIPSVNLAAKNISRIEAGLTVAPDDPTNFLSKADRFYQDRSFTQACGKNARNYAEEAFKIDWIGQQFLDIIEKE